MCVWLCVADCWCAWVHGSFDKAIALIDNHNYPVDYEAESGLSCLMSAAVAGNVGVINQLVERGADTNAASTISNLAPVMYAIRSNHHDAAGLCLFVCAVCVDFRFTLVCFVWLWLLVLKLDNTAALIKGGATVNVVDGDLRSPLIHSAIIGTAATITLLLDAGADLEHRDSDGNTALAAAVAAGNLPTVSRLIAAGANVNSVDNDGASVILIAATAGHVGLLRQLARAGGDVLLAAHDGTTPLMEGVQAGAGGVVQALLELGADAEARNSEGESVWYVPLVAPRRWPPRPMVALVLVV